MANTTITGSGVVSALDYKYVKWVGRTKGGDAVQIVLPRAICRSNPDWKFEEKTEAVAEIEFEGVYSDEDLAKDDRTEPWELTDRKSVV